MIERDFSVGEPPSVKISVRSGAVRIQPGGPGVVRILVDTTDPSFEVTQRGDSVYASGKRGGRADVTAYVPPLTDIEISTASADVDVATPVARLEVAAASADLDFDTALRLEAKSASGSIRGGRVEGEAWCLTASGDVRIGTIVERGDISTASGDITVEDSAGQLSLSTLSGDIRVARHTGPDLIARSMSGGVRIGIPPRTRLDLDATTLSGKVRLPEPTPGGGAGPPEREMTVRSRSVSGDIRIDRLD